MFKMFKRSKRKKETVPQVQSTEEDIESGHLDRVAVGLCKIAIEEGLNSLLDEDKNNYTEDDSRGNIRNP